MQAIRQQALAFMAWWRQEPDGHSILIITVALGLFSLIVLLIKAIVG